MILLSRFVCGPRVTSCPLPCYSPSTCSSECKQHCRKKPARAQGNASTPQTRYTIASDMGYIECYSVSPARPPANGIRCEQERMGIRETAMTRLRYALYSFACCLLALGLLAPLVAAQQPQEARLAMTTLRSPGYRSAVSLWPLKRRLPPQPVSVKPKCFAG